MKSILRKITILFFIFLSFSLFGCKTSSQNEADTLQSEKDAKTLQDSMQQINTSVQPEINIPNIMEGPVPPHTKNIQMFYYVQSGDTLAKVARKIYGNSASWKKLATLNNLKNANQIYAGDVLHYELTLETKSFAEAYENAPKGKIVIKKGDTLSRVSKAVFGNVAEWRVLWKENPDIKNPDKIEIGQEIYFKPKALKIKDEVVTEVIQKETPHLEPVTQ